MITNRGNERKSNFVAEGWADIESQDRNEPTSNLSEGRD